MNLQKVSLSSTSFQLSHSLNERRTLNISNSTSQLNDTNIWLLICIIDRDPCNSLNPVLNCVRKMRDNLDSLSQVVASPLTLNYVLIDLTCCDIVLPCEGDVEVSFVISEVEIDFSAVVEDKDFTVPGRPSSASFKPTRTFIKDEAYSVGAIVPASTFMYGSILIEETCKAS